jgi:RNA polymerase-binding transcription factor DksA
MDLGLFGICVRSGEPIRVGRLEALPFATTVVEWAVRV